MCIAQVPKAYVYRVDNNENNKNSIILMVIVMVCRCLSLYEHT